jgi:hypothetical protein
MKNSARRSILVWTALVLGIITLGAFGGDHSDEGGPVCSWWWENDPECPWLQSHLKVLFIQHMNGPDREVENQCALDVFDIAGYPDGWIGDGDIDLEDYAQWQRCTSWICAREESTWTSSGK